MENLSEKMPDGKTRRTVTAETRTLVNGIQKFFAQIRKLMRAASKNIMSTTAAPGKQPTERRTRVQLLCGVRDELFQTPGKTNG